MIPALTRFFPDLLRFSTGLSPSTRPFFVSAEVTFRCNLRCDFCNIPDYNPCPREADTAAMLKRLKESYDLGCRIVSFTGGEPLMRMDIGELVQGSREMGFCTGMVTNGLLLGKHVKSEWIHAVDVPAVSFLADEAGFNRSRQVPNAYNIIKTGIIDAVDAGIRPTLFATLSRDTLPFAAKTAAFADSLGINVFFSLVQRAPREQVDTLDYDALNIPDMNTAIDEMKRLRKEYSCIRFDFDFEKMHASGGFNDAIDCRAAQTVVCIKPDASVALPCPARTLASIPPDQLLAERWQSNDIAAIRAKKGTMPFCKNCQMICMYLPSLFGHPYMLARWILNNGF